MLFYLSIGILVLLVVAHLTLVGLSLGGVIDARWRAPLAWIAFGGVSFAYFLFLGFPFDRILLQPKLAHDIEQFERENGVKVDVGSIRGGWLFNVVASDVKILSTGGGFRRASQPGDPPEEPTLQLDSIGVRLAPLSLLAGRLGLHLDAALYGGHLRGRIALGRSSAVVDLALSNVELAKYTPLSSKWQVNIAGQASGVVDLVLDSDDAAKSKGKIDLTLRNAMIAESNPLGIQKIPKTVFDKGAGATIALRDGRAEFQEVGMHGEDLDVTLDGGIELKKKLAFSNWDARASIKTSDAFKSQVMLLDSFLAPGKGGDGVYRYRLTGSFAHPPRAMPERGAGPK